MEFRDKPMQNLVRIPEKDICKNAQKLLLDGETVVGAYKTVRDQVVFTTHRIILVDMQGVTGTRQEIFVLPYRKVLHFGIQTAGFGDPLQASQLTVCFADEHEAKFGFIGQDELLNVARIVAGENGNIIKLEHNQFVTTNRSAAVELRITLESFGTEHKKQIMKALEKKGYKPKLVRTSL